MRIAIYVRKSVAGDDRSISLESQKELCTNYFKGENTFEVFQDRGISGKNTDRPAFQELSRRVSNGEFDIVVCYKFDRIARNTLDFLTTLELFKSYNTDLVSITEGYDPSTPAGKMMVTLLASLAEMERENIKARVIDSMNQLAREGRYSGGPTPFGYEIDKTPYGSYLKLIDGETISYIFNSFLKGKSANDLGRELKMTSKGIKLILRNPLYMKSSQLANEYLGNIGYEVISYEDRMGNGYLTYGKKGSSNSNKIAVISKHEAVISDSDWIQVQVRLKTYDGHRAPRISSKTWLAQMVKCTHCNKYMKVRTTNTGVYLMCPNNCMKKYINVSKAENLILDELKKFTLDEDTINDNSKENNLLSEINVITKQIDEKDKLIIGLVDKLALANESLANRLVKTIEAYETELNNLKNIKTQKLIAMENKKSNHLFNNEKEFNDFIDSFNKLDMKEKQQSIRNIIDYIEFDGDYFTIY
ncbi:recombinase family protein [Clostridium sp.]|uniref:recombinase family protein n=1 Tax=Clostridium sp. TaxID=1506 RepID=UPI002911BCEC|nr:recombinase family protein [Clostridium sp.]MDU7212520.1 recombinase family protein [Clostridium sp.]